MTMSLSPDRLRALVGTQVHFWNCMADRLYRQDGVQAWCTGIGDAYLNGVLTTELSGSMADRAIAGVAEFFRSAQVPWIWAVTPLCRPRNLDEALRDEGFYHLGGHPVLFHDRPPAHRVSGFDIRPVRTAADLLAWTVPLYEGFGSPAGPDHRFRQLAAKAGLDPGGPLQHFVGYQDGQPAACVTLSVGRHGAGIDNVATCDRFRRRGWGSAMTRHAMAEAGRLGCSLVCLEASDMSVGLYKRLGFREGYQREVFGLPSSVPDHLANTN
jgi:ribosomal protein S18 acetylase RimI-like enzyme